MNITTKMPKDFIDRFDIIFPMISIKGIKSVEKGYIKKQNRGQQK